MWCFASHATLGFGGGGGGFAIGMDETLEVGVSRPCATYGTTASLLGDGREDFPIEVVQVWGFHLRW